MVLSVGLGIGAERRWGDGARAAAGRLFDVVHYVAMPFVAFFSMASLQLTAGLGIGLLVGYAALAVVLALAWWTGSRVLRLAPAGVGALMCVVVLVNTGYLGTPLVATILGGGAVGAAIAWDVAISSPMLLVVGFGIGAALGTRAGEGRRARLRAYVARNPPVLAVLAGLLAPRALAPDALVGAAHAVAVALIVPGF